MGAEMKMWFSASLNYEIVNEKYYIAKIFFSVPHFYISNIFIIIVCWNNFHEKKITKMFLHTNLKKFKHAGQVAWNILNVVLKSDNMNLLLWKYSQPVDQKDHINPFL